ncbi:hypothetical protein ACFW96_30600 [Streptomyces gardneri]|uniref:hypothetical protein n=1 Tax=Streptomyces gardneri TaxID=66892 RepID=UPI0036B3E3B7
MAKIPHRLFAGLDRSQARLVDYTAERDTGKPPGQRGQYRVLEDTQTLAGPRKRDPQLTVRRILVHSSANAAAQQAARNRRLEQAREELDKLQHSCGGRHYATAAKVTARIGVITSKRRIVSCLVTSVGTDEAGRPTLAWHFDQKVLAREAAADGWHALLTTLDAAEADAADILVRYKGQPVVERRRYRDFKGPLAVAPVLLHHNRRITALITVICLTLLVLCLIERQVRQALGGNQTMRGLYPDNRAARPTGRMILYHLDSLRIRAGTAIDPPTILITRAVQAHLIELLGIDETRPAGWTPQTRCAKSGSRLWPVSHLVPADKIAAPVNPDGYASVRSAGGLFVFAAPPV